MARAAQFMRISARGATGALTSKATLGESVTKFDAQYYAFFPAIVLLNNYLKEHHHAGLIYIINSAKATIQRYSDTRPGPNQPTALDISWYTNHILRTHTDISLRIHWVKHDKAQTSFDRVKHSALEAAKRPLGQDQDPQTINYQRQAAKAEATRKWEERWHASPCTSLAYRTACTKPPDGRLHPILRIQQKGWVEKPFRSKQKGTTHMAKTTRTTMLTLFRLITGHAFTGEYAMHSLWNRLPSPLPEEAIACHCGALPQTAEHILLECPSYDNARQQHLSTNGRVWSLDQLFNHPLRCIGTLRFLEETKAGAKPRSMDWEPG
jgi:hypothetical protein